MVVNLRGPNIFFWYQTYHESCPEHSFCWGVTAFLRKLQTWGATKNPQLNNGVYKSCAACQPALLPSSSSPHARAVLAFLRLVLWVVSRTKATEGREGGDIGLGVSQGGIKSTLNWHPPRDRVGKHWTKGPLLRTSKWQFVQISS